MSKTQTKSSSAMFHMIMSDGFITATQEDGRELDRRAWFLAWRVKMAHITLQKIKSKIVQTPGIFSERDENKFLAMGLPDAIMFISDVSGLSYTTVKRFYDIREAYPRKMRAKYRLLPMSHFEWALGFPGNTYKILDIDLQLADKNHGRPIPLRILKHLFPSEAAVPEQLSQLAQMETLDDVLALVGFQEPPEEKDDIPPLVYHFFQNISKVEQYITRAVELLKIPAENRAEIITLVQRLSEAIQHAKENENTKKVDTEGKTG